MSSRRDVAVAVRRGIFGGSFDPIHNGHLIVARHAADRLPLDRVHFVPAREQPFKHGRHGAAPEARLAMLLLAVAEDPRFVADARELGRAGPSYTVDTVREVRAEWPEDELFLLVGSDAAREFPLWREAPRLAELARVVVLTRPGSEPPAHGLVGEVLVVPEVPISATAIRRRVGHGEDVRDAVPPPVADYIESHHLYREGSDA